MKKVRKNLEDLACIVLDNMDSLEIYPENIESYQVMDILMDYNIKISEGECEKIADFIRSNY